MDCVGNQNHQPQGDAILPGASHPAVLDVLSASVFRGGSRRSGVLFEYSLYQVGKRPVFFFRQQDHFLAAMEREDYASAGRHLRESKWAEQVKGRAPRIIHMIVTNTAWNDL